MGMRTLPTCFQESFDPTALAFRRIPLCDRRFARRAFPLFAPTRPDINDGEVKDSLMNANRGRRDPLTTLDLSLMS